MLIIWVLWKITEFFLLLMQILELNKFLWTEENQLEMEDWGNVDISHSFFNYLPKKT